MTAQPLNAPYSQFLDNNGAPLAGGKVYTYAAGTTTPQNSYTDSTGVTPAANPVVLDSAGVATIWLSGNYKIVVKTSADVTLHTTDNITATTGAVGDMTKAVYDPANIQEQLLGLTAVQTETNKSLSAASNTINLTPITNSLSGDVTLNNTGTYFDGPSVAQGSTGTWFVSGTVTCLDSAGAGTFIAKLWDGTTIIASCDIQTSGSGIIASMALSGYLATPAGNLRISVKDAASTSGLIKFNSTGNSKDSTITAIRIG